MFFLLVLILCFLDYMVLATVLATGLSESVQLKIIYSREALLNIREAVPSLPRDELIGLPTPSSPGNKPRRKRGRKGGVRARLKRRPFRPPLPTIMFGNVQSIRNKTDELRACVQHLADYRQSCLICLSETWLTESDPDSSVELEGFTLLRADRDSNSGKTKGGGVCVFINNRYCNPAHITVKHKLCTKDIELLSVNLRPYYMPREIHQICLFIVYIAPSADIKEAGNIIHELVTLTEAKAPDAAKLILGDFNLCCLAEILPVYHQYVSCPTREGACLDLCYGNLEKAYYATALPGLGKSDHNMIRLTPTYQPLLRREKIKKKEVKCWTTDACNILRDCLDCTDWELLIDASSDINDAALAVSGYIHFCEDIIVPKKIVKFYPNNKPWITPELKELLNHKKRLFKSGGSKEDIRSVQKNIKKKILDCKTAYKNKIQSLFNHDARKAWQGLQIMTGYKPKMQNLTVLDDNAFSDDLNTFYCRFDNVDYSTQQELAMDAVRTMQFRDIQISTEEVKELFSRVNINKSQGPDGISCKLLRTCAHSLAFPFQMLFQKSVETGLIPAQWKQSLIVPVPKNNRPKEMKDLRPVALTSVPMKCLEKIILKHLLSEVAPSLDPFQFAYQPRRGVEDALLTMTNSIFEHLEEAYSFVKIVFIDFSSAFNTIQPHLLVDKLIKLGVNPRLITWINNFLLNRTQQVRFNQAISTAKVINTGAPQGCVLSPILYTLYTNECRALETTHTYFKYADDTALVGFLKTGEASMASFEEEVESFIKWCSDNFLNVNASKTKEMVIDFRRITEVVPNTVVNNTVIDRVNTYKYLGVEIDDQLRFDKCASVKVKKLQQRMFFLRKLCSFNVDTCILELFYKSVLQSVLSFGLVCVFGSMRKQDQDKLQRIIKTASRIIGCNLTSAAQLFQDIIRHKAESIIGDTTHPLHDRFQLSKCGKGRLLQRKIRTTRFSRSFVPSAIRIVNEGHSSLQRT